MVCSLMELRCKEVVNIQNGACLGCVCDVEFDTCTAHICTLIIFGRPRFFGLFGREPDLIIPWDQIKCIGEDTVLVEMWHARHRPVVGCPLPGPCTD